METELKFLVSPEARATIERRAWPPAADGEVLTDRQCTRYFDTSDRRLWKAGFTLRVRQGARGLLQTVKSAGTGTFHRQEWEWPVSSPEPDRGLLAEVAGLPDLGDAVLEAVFRTEVKRTRRMVRPASGTGIELAFDEGAVLANDGREPLSELELELKSGDEEALLRLGLDLLETAPLVLQNESKAERGYRLSDGWRRLPPKPQPVTFDRDIGVQQAFARLATAVLDDLLASQPAVLRGEEVEGVHQMRVGIRRLRSLLVLFEPVLEPHAASRFADELRRLGRVLGSARDWDVLLEKSLPAAIETAADLKTIEPLRAAADQRRHAAHQDAKKAVQEPAFTRFVLAFRAWTHSAEATMSDRVAPRPEGSRPNPAGPAGAQGQQAVGRQRYRQAREPA